MLIAQLDLMRSAKTIAPLFKGGNAGSKSRSLDYKNG
jgi:hypothetical protein